MALDWERRGLLQKCLSLEQVELTGARVLVHAFARSTVVACPQCGRRARQVPSRYRRGLTELPAHGREVKILLVGRRFSRNSFPPRLPVPMRDEPPDYRAWCSSWV